jgi:CRP-like cAMP-binding protein
VENLALKLFNGQLAKSNFFSNVAPDAPPGLLPRMAGLMELVAWKAGDYPWIAGSEPVGLVFLFEGTVSYFANVGNNGQATCIARWWLTGHFRHAAELVTTVPFAVYSQECYIGDLEMLKPEMRLFSVKCERDISGVQLRRDPFRRLIREYPLVLDRFKRTVSWREARAFRRVQRAVAWNPNDCYDLAAWIIHAALRGYLVRRRNTKSGAGKGWNAFIHKDKTTLADAAAGETPAASKGRQWSPSPFSSPMLSRLDFENPKSREKQYDPSVEGRISALENKVATNHTQISNQIAELARLIEHLSFNPPQPKPTQT